MVQFKGAGLTLAIASSLKSLSKTFQACQVFAGKAGAYLCGAS
jgi:hypothetical protein